MQRLRIRYAKTGRMRFTSHRDFARAFERALRRAAVPMAYSAGFSPHPKISYAGAAPTGVASRAEYLEIGLARSVDPDELRVALDAALPPGLDVITVVGATDPKAGLAERLEASAWQIRLPGTPPEAAVEAIGRFLALDEAPVERATKDGRRTIDARAPIVAVSVSDPAGSGAVDTDRDHPYAIIDLVVRHATPAVRPDDVVAALREHACLPTPESPFVTRLAQGRVPPGRTDGGSAALIELIDPLADDIAATDFRRPADGCPAPS